jgi:hypothetical protein
MHAFKKPINLQICDLVFKLGHKTKALGLFYVSSNDDGGRLMYQPSPASGWQRSASLPPVPFLVLPIPHHLRGRRRSTGWRSRRVMEGLSVA